MTNLIGVIVDGPGDFASIKARFKGLVKVVKTDGPRGHSVTVPQLVEGSKRQIAILKAFGCRYVILMLDFERRAFDYNVFVANLETEIMRRAFAIRVKVCVPNRMIENWYLADLEEISSKKNYIRSGLVQRPFEGTDGKRQLKEFFKPDFSYNEVKHGPELFSVVRFQMAVANSASFRTFLDKLGVAI